MYYISAMENTVTLTLERYHELLDKSEELERLSLGEIKVTSTKDGYFSEEIKIEFLNNNDAINELSELVKQSDDLYERKYKINESENKFLSMQNDSLNNQLSQIKNHWAYKLFIKKGG